ncbi:hypothetical protein BDF22DRAFT_692248 [Syncephalis plumigaleata]|nr:hypothetical protein BDF22DRAFT_692248 [Syncephalis plumigaleata]
MLEQAQLLFSQSLVSSAQLMTGMLLSELQRSTTTNNSSTYVEALLLFARCLVHHNEYRRAMGYFDKALHHQQIIQRFKITTIDDLDITICIEYAECCLKVNDWETARLKLEGLARDRRTLSVWRLLAKVYQLQGNFDAATDCYVTILKEQPFAIEAATALIGLGVSLTKVNKFIQMSALNMAAKDNGHSLVDVNDDILRWIAAYIRAENSYNMNNYQGALKLYRALEQRYPKNTHLGLKIANCQVNLGDTLNAYNSFMAVRTLDAKVVESMDRFAGLIRGQGNMLLLNRMAEDLMNINEFRPEPWVAMAVYCQCRNQPDRALMLTDRALALDRQHAEAHYIKATILRLTNRLHESFKEFRVAYQYSRDPYVYQGLFDLHIQQGNLQAAEFLAEEALERMPNNAIVLSLVANVYSHTQDQMDKPKELIERAFKIDPASMSALRALQRILVKEGKYDEAVVELKKRLPMHNNELCIHYNIALSLDPNSTEAQKGKAEVEGLLPRQDNLPMDVLNEHGEEGEEEEEDILDSSVGHGMLRVDRGHMDDDRRRVNEGDQFSTSPFHYDDSLLDDPPFF